ncbi:MAG: YicC family protein [Chlorobi bacterium]|nr:YicC family protein [Chlorobiota bacterium]
MTGYGKETCHVLDKKIIIEIRSLNSKQFDLNTKIPSYYKEKELFIRNLLVNKLSRGKIDFNLFVEANNGENVANINEKAISNYYSQLKQIAENLDIKEEQNWFSTLIKLPDVLKSERTVLSNEEWDEVLPSIENAINYLIVFREQDGFSMEQDITKRIYSINNLISEIEVFEEERINNIKNRILVNLAEMENKGNYDKNRFEQELIYYLEKLDITEEKVRLSNHCNYFIENMKSEESVGKKLGFISQEIGREINTIGSKANNADIQRIVVQMKDELEKIKEQLMNVL